jgi:predicted kinase
VDPTARDDAGSKLIIVCGLPDSGKTTLAKRLGDSMHAAGLSPDDWMDALSLNPDGEPFRAKIETL